MPKGQWRDMAIALCRVLTAMLVMLWVQASRAQEAAPVPEMDLPQALARPPTTPVAVLGQHHRLLHDPCGCCVLSFSPEGAFLASTNRCQEIRVLDLASGETVWLWRYPELLKTSIGELVWPFCPFAEPAWRDGNWELIQTDHAPGWPGGHGAFFGPDGETLSVVHNPSLSHTHVVLNAGEDLWLDEGIWLTGGYVHIFGRPQLELDRTIETAPPRHLSPRGAIFGGLPWVTAFDYSPSGEFVATGSSDGILALWRTSDGAHVDQVRAEFGPRGKRMLCALDFSPAGDAVVTVGDNGVVRLWSAPSLELQAELPGHAARGYWVEFSPDGVCAASAAKDGLLCVWHLPTGRCVRSLNWQAEIGGRAHFTYSASPDSIFFGATREGGTVGAVSTTTGRVMWIRAVDLVDVTALTTSPTRDLLAGGDCEGNILVWPTARSTGILSMLPDR